MHMFQIVDVWSSPGLRPHLWPQGPRLAELVGYKSKELQRVLDIIMEHLDLLREAWNEHFTY